MKRVLNTIKNFKNQKAFSLLEVLLTLAIFGILIVLISYIIVINFRIANMVNARTKVREETSYLLKNLKKDIRNAEDITEDNSGNLVVEVVPPGQNASVETRTWSFNSVDKKVLREADGTQDFLTPGDIDITSFTFDLQEKENNTIVILNIKARTIGMPEGQNITKNIAVSTRVFEKD